MQIRGKYETGKKFEIGNSGKPKGAKAKKTILKEDLGLNSTKDLARFVILEGNKLFSEAQTLKDWNKKYLVWKELAKAGLPKTVINTEIGFEEWLKQQDNEV